jgi:hypothetical protein
MRMPFYMRPHSFASSARTHGTKRKRRRNEADLPVTGVGQAGLAPLNLLYIYIYCRFRLIEYKSVRGVISIIYIYIERERERERERASERERERSYNAYTDKYKVCMWGLLLSSPWSLAAVLQNRLLSYVRSVRTGPHTGPIWNIYIYI